MIPKSRRLLPAGLATGQPAAQTGEADGLFRSRLPSNRTMGPAPYPRSPWFASYDASAVSRYYNSSVQLVCGLARAAHTTTCPEPKPAKCATSPDQVRRACPGSCRSTLRPVVMTWGRMQAPGSSARLLAAAPCCMLNRNLAFTPASRQLMPVGLMDAALSAFASDLPRPRRSAAPRAAAFYICCRRR